MFVAVKEERMENKQIITTQFTSKRIKGHIIFGWVLFCASMVALLTGEQALWSVGGIVGILWVAVAKIVRWWHHA